MNVILFMYTQLRIVGLGLFFFLGNTPFLRADASSEDLPLSVKPATLDFGRVNNASGPLRLSFSISNRGNQPVEITGARSGCGCTVPRLAKSVLSPHEQTTIEVEVRIAGRIGPFSNHVLVDVTGQPEPISVPIRGTITQDLWLDGPVVQCFAKDSSPTTETTFEIRTVEWPAVEFAPPLTGPGVSVREVSRSKVGDETAIKFRVVMDTPGNETIVRQDVVLSPLDRRIRGLTIPIVIMRTMAQHNQASPIEIDGAKAEDVERQGKPNRVSLGVISREQEYQIKLSGEPELIRTLKLSGVEGLPQGVIVELRPIDESKPNRIQIAIRLGKSTRLGPLDGRIRLTSRAGPEQPISVIGIVGPGSPSRGTKSSDVEAQAQAGH